MQIGALGDIHGEFEAVHLLMARHPDAPLHFIKGNNEDFDVLAAAVEGEAPATTLHYLRNGGPHRVGPWRVAALGGTFAPSWYNTSPSALPPSKGRKSAAPSLKLGKSRDDKRRHFVRDEVLACKALSNIDLFMTHEAPRPFYPAGRRIDAGKTVLNDVLAALRPRLHLFGHHHEFTDTVRQSVRSIGLDIVTKSYLLVDAETFKTERLDT